MWTIAGLLLGTMIFVSSYGMISRYVYKNELGQAMSTMSLLKSSVEGVCQGGVRNEEIKSLVFPAVVSKVFILGNDNIEESGDRLCMKIENEARKCYTLPFCTYEMPTITLGEEARAYHLMDKILGRRKMTRMVFSISKPSPGEVMILWNQTYTDNH